MQSAAYVNLVLFVAKKNFLFAPAVICSEGERGRWKFSRGVRRSTCSYLDSVCDANG